MEKSKKTDKLILIILLLLFTIAYPWGYLNIGLQSNVLVIIPVLFISLRFGVKMGALGWSGLSLYIALIRFLYNDPDLALGTSILIAGFAGLGGALFGLLGDQRRALKKSEERLEARVNQQTVELRRLVEELELAYDTTLKGWAKALELRDKETEGHSRRVTELAIRFGKALNLPTSDIVQIRYGALLHDVGKMGIPDNILNKPGKLTSTERKIIEKHPVYSHNMLKDVNFLKEAITIPCYHHERWDGSGYPEGLKEKEIPLNARLFSLVDNWDALNSDRPYRKAWKRDDVIKYIRENSGKIFDPELAGIFLSLVEN